MLIQKLVEFLDLPIVDIAAASVPSLFLPQHGSRILPSLFPNARVFSQKLIEPRMAGEVVRVVQQRRILMHVLRNFRSAVQKRVQRIEIRISHGARIFSILRCPWCAGGKCPSGRRDQQRNRYGPRKQVATKVSWKGNVLHVECPFGRRAKPAKARNVP
jgi:hypothetical protein